MTLFKGAGVALITPFNEDETVNYDMLGQLIDRQIEGHTDAIIVCGTTGEPVTMSEEEKLSVIEYTVKRVNHRIPVIAGAGANSTKLVIVDVPRQAPTTVPTESAIKAPFTF